MSEILTTEQVDRLKHQPNPNNWVNAVHLERLFDSHEALRARAEVAEAALATVTAERGRMAEALALLKRGSCWCEMAIGNPMVRHHDKGCMLAAEAERDALAAQGKTL